MRDDEGQARFRIAHTVVAHAEDAQGGGQGRDDGRREERGPGVDELERRRRLEGFTDGVSDGEDAEVAEDGRVEGGDGARREGADGVVGRADVVAVEGEGAKSGEGGRVEKGDGGGGESTVNDVEAVEGEELVGRAVCCEERREGDVEEVKLADFTSQPSQRKGCGKPV